MAAETAPPLLFVNGRIVDPSIGMDAPGGVLIENGVIRDVGPHLDKLRPVQGVEVRDCRGMVISPGLVDMRVFVGEPGEEHRETLRTAGEAAAIGGVTSIVCQPATSPPLDDAPSIDFVKRRARDRCVVRVHPMAALTKGLAGQEMTEFGLLKEAGAVAYSDGMRAVMNAQVMRRALSYGRMFGVLIVQHCEDPDLVGEGVMNEGEFAARLGLHGVPALAETVVLERDLRILAATGGRYHAALLSTAEALPILKAAKASGLQVTAGISINHLTFNENDVGAYRTFFKLAPPLRSEADRQALIEALAEGLIDVVVSDHNPQDVETKRLTFAEAAHGAAGLETMLSAGLRLVQEGQVTLTRLIHAMSTAPSEILGLPTGRLTPGAPADLIVFDPEEPWVCNPDEMRGRSKNTPFDGAKMVGRVKLTVVGGRVVHDTGGAP